jgi:hypothetical protein
MSDIKLFEAKKVRTHWDEETEQWFFSVQDVVEALTDSADIKQYIKKLRARDPELFANWGTICTLVEMTASDGKKRKIQAANTESLLRIIQSIPSPKAEPFKRWLAQVGYELPRVDNSKSTFTAKLVTAARGPFSACRYRYGASRVASRLFSRLMSGRNCRGSISTEAILSAVFINPKV